MKYIRKAAGLIRFGRYLSQKELASELGVSRRTVINWESGTPPRRRGLDKLKRFVADELGVEIGDGVLLGANIKDVLGPLSLYITGKKLTPSQRNLMRYLMLRVHGLTDDMLGMVLKRVEDVLNSGGGNAHTGVDLQYNKDKKQE